MAVGVGDAHNLRMRQLDDERKRSEELEARDRVNWNEPLTMKLQDILEGDTPEATDALDELFGDLKDEKILWYPSAGFDYRDILEMTAPRLDLHGIKEPPNIICHTDYNPGLIDLGNEIRDIVHIDPRTTVRIMEKYALSLRDKAQVVYRVNPEYAYPDSALLQPTIYLLKLRITSDVLGEIPATVLFFLFENHNFLAQVILKHGLRITHFIKVRDTCGNRMCSSVFYPLLGNIGVRYLIADEGTDSPESVFDKAAKIFPFSHKAFALYRMGKKLKWSGNTVRIFEVIPKTGELTREELAGMLGQISG